LQSQHCFVEWFFGKLHSKPPRWRHLYATLRWLNGDGGFTAVLRRFMDRAKNYPCKTSENEKYKVANLTITTNQYLRRSKKSYIFNNKSQIQKFILCDSFKWITFIYIDSCSRCKSTNSGACKLGAPTCEAAAATVAAATAVVVAAFVAVATARRAFVQNISAPWWRNSPGCSPGRRIDYWTNSVIPGDLRSRSFSERTAICTMLVTINRNADQNSFTSDTFVLKIWSKFKWYRKKR